DDDILADAHWLVHRLDLRSRSAWRARRAVQCLYTAGFSLTGWPGFADRAFSPTTGPLSAAASRAPAGLYIAHFPAALPAVGAAARLHSAAYAFDAEDFHLGDWPDGGEQEGVRRMLRAIEARYLPGCLYVSAASPGIADAYVEAYGIKRPTVIFNVFPSANAPQ